MRQGRTGPGRPRTLGNGRTRDAGRPGEWPHARRIRWRAVAVGPGPRNRFDRAQPRSTSKRARDPITALARRTYRTTPPRTPRKRSYPAPATCSYRIRALRRSRGALDVVHRPPASAPTSVPDPGVPKPIRSVDPDARSNFFGNQRSLWPVSSSRPAHRWASGSLQSAQYWPPQRLQSNGSPPRSVPQYRHETMPRVPT